MEKTDLDKLVRQWMDEKKVRPSRINRPLTYQLYNELMNPKMKRSEKDCSCLDRDTDLKVTKWIENEYKLDPLPISSNVKIELKGLTAEKPKTTRKRRTTKKSADEGDTPN